jgi:membrane protease YdiL (CAAX protease family)
MHSPLNFRPLAIGLGVTALAAGVSHLAPLAHAANAVALVFVGATYLLVLKHDSQHIAAHGLALGGLFEPEPLSARRIGRDLARAGALCAICAAITFPAFWIGYYLWFSPENAFELKLHSGFWDEALGQLLVIALPEEMFYRGYLQSSLRSWDRTRLRVFGTEIGASLLLSSAIFALGHVLSTPHPSRLAVFFPSLLFGWLRARTGGIGSSVLYHAACNLFSSLVARGYALAE